MNITTIKNHSKLPACSKALRWLFASSFVFLASCATYEVRTTDFQSVETLNIETPDEYLLDIGIEILDPNLEGTPEDTEDERVFSQVREAESIWVAQKLKETLEKTNAWGAVRITPDDEVIMDLSISGKVLQSDGETLRLHVTASDQTGRIWLEDSYSQVISKYAYDKTQRTYEPFQGLYNQIANDLLSILRHTSLAARAEIRTVSAMKFARSFSPEAFDQYLITDEDGFQQVIRTPSDKDPLLARVKSIQARDQLFVDVLQDYYHGFSNNMDEPYHEWRAQSYKETQIIRQLENSARKRRLAGWLAIIAGAAARIEGNANAGAAGAFAIYAGVQELRGSYAQRDEVSLHIEKLSELGQSIEEQLAPSVIELQDRSITLTGTVRDQYAEWRKLLADMYYAETGYPRPQEKQPSVDKPLAIQTQ